MKYILSCLFTFNFFTGIAQNQIIIDKENSPQGVTLYATNIDYCPISAQFVFKLDNLRISSGEQNIFVIPARAIHFKLVELVPIEHKKWGYSYGVHTNFGNVALNRYDTNYVYDLPFKKGKELLVFQGYNGAQSHQNEYALDFTMPEGTDVVAARDGVVIKVFQSFTIACTEEECKKMNNVILIYHSDGTYATYAHIQFNGAKVKEGDTVKAGDVIALSGNVGYSTGPHLHFAVYLPSLDKPKTINTI